MNMPCNSMNISPVKQENPVLLQPYLSEKSELQRALITAQNQLKTAQHKINMLETAHTTLKTNLAQLAEKCIKFQRFAYQDDLTGLPNRNLLMDRLNQALVQASRQNKRVALLFIDLDDFKSINDNFGHTAGDTLLQRVAGRLSACIRYCDTVCRYGGDEFVILLPEIPGPENVSVVTEKIRSQLHEPYEIDNEIHKISASIGCSISWPNGQNSHDLIKQADMAMYRVKANQSLRQVVQKKTDSTPNLFHTTRLIIHRLCQRNFQKRC